MCGRIKFPMCGFPSKEYLELQEKAKLEQGCKWDHCGEIHGKQSPCPSMGIYRWAETIAACGGQVRTLNSTQVVGP